MFRVSRRRRRNPALALALLATAAATQFASAQDCPLSSRDCTTAAMQADCNTNGVADACEITGCDPFLFQVGSAVGPGTNVLGIATGDFDGDGLDDVAFADNMPGSPSMASLKVSRNNGGLFATPVAVESPVANLEMTGIAVADIDHDNRRDIVAVLRGLVSNPGQVRIYLNRTQPGGAMTFAAPSASAGTQIDMEFLLGFGSQIAAGDLDRDGDIDIVVSGGLGNGVTALDNRLIQNHGVPGFVRRDLPGGAIVPTGITLGLINDDDALDLIVSESTTQSGGRGYRHWLNSDNGQVSFGSAVSHGVPPGSNSPQGVTAAVLLRRPAMRPLFDFLLWNSPDAGHPFGMIRLRNSSGEFESLGVDTPGRPIAAAASDFDLDGDADIALVDDGNVARFLRNESGVLVRDASTNVVPSGNFTGLAVGRLNSDSRPDLVLALRNVGFRPIFNAMSLAAVRRDCNTNGVPDECEIAAVPARDCNTNGLMDLCELFRGGDSDCDTNGVLDRCDVAQGAPDCNTNGEPDRCELSIGIVQDCNTDNVADLCQGGCNTNAVPDACDTAGGNDDCNTNRVPDECEMSGRVLSTWTAAQQFWNGAANWCPRIVPNNSSQARFDVRVLQAGSVVTLDVNPTIDSLQLAANTTVIAGASGGADVRTLAVVDAPGGQPGEFVNAGVVAAGEGTRFVVDVSRIDQSGGGVLRAVSPTSGSGRSVLEISHARISGGRLETIGPAAEIHLIGGATLDDAEVKGVVVPDGQSGAFSDQVILNGSLQVAPGDRAFTLFTADGPSARLAGNGGGDDSVTLGSESYALMGGFVNGFTNNAGSRIDGTGLIFGDLVNHGVIEANQPDRQLSLLSFGEKTNGASGVLSARSGGILNVQAEVSGGGLLIADHDGVVEVAANLIGNASMGGMALMSRGGRLRIRRPGGRISVDTRGPILSRQGSDGSIEFERSDVTGVSHVNIGDGTGDGRTELDLLDTTVCTVEGVVHVFARGTLLLNNSTLNAAELVLDPGATLIAHSTLDIRDRLSIETTDAALPTWQVDASALLRMSGGIGVDPNSPSLSGWATLEAASPDAGPRLPGDPPPDFFIPRLEIGADSRVSLIDLYNTPAAPRDAVYCGELTLQPRSVLNLNGRRLYVNGAAVQVGPYGQGAIQDVPRCSTQRGDFTCDGQLTAADVPGFAAALLSDDPLVSGQADMNDDGRGDGDDIAPFLLLLGEP